VNAKWHLSPWLVVCVALLVGVGLGFIMGEPRAATAQQPDGSVGRYTVVHTEGTNLIVTDNKANMLYFYTVDTGDQPGSDLKLRGSLDLSQVGKQTLTPKLLKKAQ
jgi:hypothetical protein